MSTHTLHDEINETYFCTITCHKWISLIEKADAYEEAYKWFGYLRKDKCHILGYVIMPNHIHCLLFPTLPEKSLNSQIGKGKRFMAYGIVKRLRLGGEENLLALLARGVQPNERVKGKQHQIFRLSSDARKCFDEKMLEQKLDYIHHNPVSGKWNLVEDFTDYPHSSAAYYELGAENEFVTHYKYVSAVE